MTQENINKILEIGILLSSEHDVNRLLEQILSCAMELTHCDAGTLYLLDNDVLRFRIMRNNTLKTYIGGDGTMPQLPPVPLSRENVCALALLDNRNILVEDVRSCDEYDFSGPMHYDALTKYRTKSMLVVPMRNRQGERLGVLQLINALDEEGNVCGFVQSMVLLAESVASQAAVTIQNVRYMKEIKELFHSFVRAMSTAVDERTPYNGSHPRHMAEYCSRFIDYLNTRSDAPHFTPAQKEELMMSIWLHDIGKLVTPLEVMNKARRLLPEQYANFSHRMETIRLLAQIRQLKGDISASERDVLVRQTQEASALVDQANSAVFLKDDLLEELTKLRDRIYAAEDGSFPHWLTQEEYDMLSIRRGTLSEAERKIMEQHVEITDKLLSQIHFSKDMSHVREWAASHHELLNGGGYPRRLKGDEIPLQVRIITILDIFDALVANDRPYKKALPLSKALSILRENAEQRGELDPVLTGLFIESRCWEYSETFPGKTDEALQTGV